MTDREFFNSSTYTPLTDWANEPTTSMLKADLSEAISYHQTHVQKVNDWLDGLRGEFRIKTQEGRSRVQPKLIRKQNEWRYSALEEPFLSTDDMFKVNPVSYMDVEPAKQNQLVINKQFRVDINKTQFINKYIRTAVNTGTVIVKLSWEVEKGVVREEQMQPVFAQSPEQFMAYGQALIQQGQADEQNLMMLMQSGEWQQVPIGEEPVTVMVEKEIVNKPVLEVKDSRTVVIDPSCAGDVDKAQFIIDRFLTDLSTLKKDGRYSNLEKIQDKAYDDDSGLLSQNIEYREEHNFKFQDKPRKKLVAYEYWGYWDIHDDGVVVPIVATWVGDVMIRLEENPYPDKKLPYVVTKYLPQADPYTVYGEADAALLKDNQDIIGAVTRGMIDLIGRSANAQTGIRKDLLDPINLDKYKKGLDFEVNPVANLSEAIYVAKMPEVPRSALEIIQLQNNEAEALTGVKAFSNGINSQAFGDVVTNARSAMDATAKRELGILRRLADGLIAIGKKVISMNSVWLSDEEVIRITDEDFVAIKRDDLAGNFDLRLEVSTAEVDNQKASELAFMMQTIGPNVDFNILKILMAKIANLRKMPDVEMAIKQYEPQPDPLAIARQEAEIGLIQAQTQKEASAAPKNIADEYLKYAKAQQAGSASRKTESEADLDDLNYLEQSSGLQQDRLLEEIAVKEQAKAISNQSKQSANSKGK